MRKSMRCGNDGGAWGGGAARAAVHGCLVAVNLIVNRVMEVVGS